MTSSKKEILNLLYEDPIQLGIWCGFNKLTSLHNTWLREMLYGTKDYTLQAHRESYKTTTESVYLAIQIILWPDRECLFFRKTQADVELMVRQVHNILDSGYAKNIVKVLYGVDLTYKKQSSTEIDTNLHTSTSGGVQLRGLSISSSITGLHGWVVTDDIVTIKDRYSRAEREATKTKYDEISANIRLNGTKIINLGTPWHEEDAFSHMPEPVKYDCYSTGIMSEEQIKETEESLDPATFACNYKLEHIKSAGSLFKDATFYNGDANDLIGGTAQIDAAYGGEDFTAFTIMRRMTNNTIIALGKMWHKHVDDCIAEIMALVQAYNVPLLYLEDNADKGYLAKSLKQYGIPATTYHEKMNKHQKIVSYLYKEWGNIEWLDETDSSYISQICGYEEGASHDDAPDSAASLVSRLTLSAVRTIKRPSRL